MSVSQFTQTLKPKYDFDQMIEHFKGKGIEFKMLSETEAKEILMNSNYFFKITSYRGNFPKNNKNGYTNLDFKMLLDLSTIDMRLRYILLHMALDIEHSIKTKMLRDITNDPSEDGYQICHHFIKHYNQTKNPKTPKTPSSLMSYLKNSSHYHHDLYLKHHKNPPIWVVMETITFGDFVSLVEYYASVRLKNKDKFYNELRKTFKFIKNIRNLAAHSSPIIHDVTSEQISSRIIEPVTSYVNQIPTITTDLRRKRLKNQKVHDITVLLMIHEKYAGSSIMKRIRYEELVRLMNRCLRHKECYQTHPKLHSVYHYMNNLIHHIHIKHSDKPSEQI